MKKIDKIEGRLEILRDVVNRDRIHIHNRINEVAGIVHIYKWIIACTMAMSIIALVVTLW